MLIALTWWQVGHPIAQKGICRRPKHTGRSHRTRCQQPARSTAGGLPSPQGLQSNTPDQLLQNLAWQNAFQFQFTALLKDQPGAGLLMTERDGEEGNGHEGQY